MATSRNRIGSTAAPRRRTVRAYSSPPCLMHELQPGSAAARTLKVHIKRVYEPPAQDDGYRVLVDRVWPRGVSRQDAALDEWLRDLAPSTGLRKWFAHDPKRWSAFHKRYRLELTAHTLLLQGLRRRAARQRLTLLYGARDTQMNQAVVIKEAIEDA